MLVINVSISIDVCFTQFKAVLSTGRTCYAWDFQNINLLTLTQPIARYPPKLSFLCPVPSRIFIPFRILPMETTAKRSGYSGTS